MTALPDPFWLRYLPASLRHRFAHRPNLLKILNNAAWLFSDKILRMGVGLVVSVWLARYLGPEDFGLFNFAIAFVSLFGALSTLGLPGIVVRDLVSDPKGRFETLGSAFALQIGGGLIAFSVLIALISIFRPQDRSACAVVTIIGLTLLFKGSESIKYWFESQVQSKYTVWAENSVFVAMAGIKIGFILFGMSLFAFAWVTVVEGVIAAIVLLAIYQWAGETMWGWHFSIVRAKTLLKHSWPLILSGLAVMVYMRIDQIMLGQMLNDRAVGIYSAAVRISEAWYFIPMAIAGSVFPALLDAKKTSEALYLEKFQTLYDTLVVIALVVAIPVTFLASQIIVTLFGQEYREAGTILSIHIWTALFVFLGVASGKWFLAENRQVLALHRVLWGMGINLGLNILWIPQYGGVGAAVATLVSQAVAALLIDLVHKETRLMFRMKLRACLLMRVFRVQCSS
ncbi:MAG: flippase [Nitrospira sp.]|nr:flippase [Nitrospira sp.]